MTSRYNRVAVIFHWGLGMALIAQLTLGATLDAIAPRGTPGRAAVINLHKSCGIVLLLLIAARLVWRMRHAAPPWPASMTNWERFAAAWTHNGLYACMLVSPLSGWAASNFSKHGVRFFGIKLEPLGPDLPAVYALLGGVHDVAGWIFIGLLTLHVAAAFKHLWLDRDGIFSRMSWRAPRLGGVATAVRQLKEPT